MLAQLAQTGSAHPVHLMYGVTRGADLVLVERAQRFAERLDFFSFTTCVVVLSALEIDTKFNVNVITGSDGIIRGASGGHSDTAAHARLAIIVAPLVRGRIPTVVKIK